MASGTEMAMNALFKMLGIDPETVKKQMLGFQQIVIDLKAQMDRIERDQKFIMEHLGVTEHGRSEVEKRDFAADAGTVPVRLGAGSGKIKH